MKIREKIPGLLVRLSIDTYRKIFKHNKTTWAIKYDDLAKMNSNTLGYELYQFLKMNQIQLLTQFETHDIFHIITGYTIHPVDEIRMQYFLLGNGKRSLFLIGTICLGTILLPEYFLSYHRAFQKGSNVLPIYNWQFEHLLNEDFFEMKKLIYKKRNELKLFNHIQF